MIFINEIDVIIQFFFSGLTFVIGQQYGIKKAELKHIVILNEIKVMNNTIQELKEEIKEIQPTVITLKNEVEHCKDDIKKIKE